ncbi:MAG TPA: cytochrome c-type biogenesis protein CcmH [Hyphomicrobiaceae bacterium]|nr:cytochrome c-type biogenesis protein CcmH [Hyphomicrobiaceae bacterium]
MPKTAALLRASALSILLASGAQAIEPGERLSDPALESRARALSAELRCLVCQNQSIDDSNAPLAKDLRLLVRERITAGDTDKDVLKFVVARYGDFVLLRPPFNLMTLALWLTPLLALIGGVIAFRRSFAALARSSPGEQPLSDAERRRLDEILRQPPDKSV